LKEDWLLCYERIMLQAFVGIASKAGLAQLSPEHDATLLFARRAVRAERVAFWVVLTDQDARRIQALFESGYSREALVLLDQVAKDIGRVLPSDTVLSRIH